MELDGSMVLLTLDAPDLRVVPGLLGTFHCDRCSALLGDSMALCGELRSMDALVLLICTGTWCAPGVAASWGPSWSRHRNTWKF
ncbi:hypothetical protein CRUP_031284 [Coryphaenoides rupestris]|nr:hypothetical protein CRUP_031284 [Coryphaenoides rupestris]